MLTITNIKKVYKTGTLVQQALGGVSLSLRDSEFVAVLGASGSGKTTLLNIIGGLDRYDEGDLVINGVSTKRYTDRDWDSYRNHTVGFVFQSYNLIPHQTVLKNVELALTISGISAKERERRATEALVKVGLEEHIHKKPSQLSGGQMQRVAIARALVNDPDILLADEPTGALDSETSIQVLDLLKEVARDRLVVMVTHNPELAERYATRIVTLKDGLITSDSDPYEPEPAKTVHRNLGKASMSFLTSLALSFNNLWTKKTRTILVSFAGSIGIIGIAMILAVSTGANLYIRSVEEESLQSYPLTISDTSFSLLSLYTESGVNKEESENKKDVEEWRAVSSLLSGVSANDLGSLRAYFESDECDIYDYVQALEYSYGIEPQFYKDTDDGYRQMNSSSIYKALGFTGNMDSMNSLFSTMGNSDLFFSLPRDKGMMEASYELKAGQWPQSYNECVVALAPSGRITDVTLYALGLKDPNELDEMVQAFVDGSVTEVSGEPNSYYYSDILGKEFRLLPAASYYTYDEEYKVWKNRSSDKKYMKEQLDSAEVMRIVGIIQPLSGGTAAESNFGIAYTAELIDHVIELASQSDIVKAQLSDPDIDVFTGKPFGEKGSGDDISLSSLFSVDEDAISDAFKIETDDLDLSSLDLSSLDFSDLDLSSALSAQDMGVVMPNLSEEDIAKMFENIKLDVTAEELGELFKDVMNDYLSYAGSDPRADAQAIPRSVVSYLGTADARGVMLADLQKIIEEKSAIVITADDFLNVVTRVMENYPAYLEAQGLTEDDREEYLAQYLSSDEARSIADSAAQELIAKLRSKLIDADDVVTVARSLADGYEKYADEQGLPSVSYLLTSFSDYMKTDGAKERIMAAVTKSVDTSGLNQAIDSFSGMIGSAVEAVIGRVTQAISGNISSVISGGMEQLMGSMSSDIMDVFNFDADTLSDMFKMNMSAEELQALMTSLLSDTAANYKTNLKQLGYMDKDDPSTITIYPLDFDSKTHIKQLISDYNARMAAAGEDDKVIQYTDMVDTLMSSVSIIIDVISYVLIAFVAISLVVSSIMIGVITYISVLERRKEIGILRAIGASKRNISQVFNAETFIIGLLAGVIGITVTELLIIPANLILHSLSGVENINAVLPFTSAIILIALSVVLTLIGGIIPSRKAAKSDPVTALRSE